MRKTLILLTYTWFVLWLIPISWAQPNSLNFNDQTILKALELFENGSYQTSLDTLENLSPQSRSHAAKKSYIQGLAYNKLQRFNRAVEALSMAAKLKHPATDLYYELGQALYANNQLEKARSAFIQSYKKKFKSSVSLYYMGHISQLLMQNKKAIGYYQTLIKTDKEDASLRQIARFKMAESLLTLAENIPKNQKTRVIDKTVLPLLRLALRTEPNSELTGDIEKRIIEIQDMYGLDPSKMVNGRQIPKSPWKLYAAQRIKSDDNVTLANDQPTVSTTQRESYISDTVVDFSYRSLFKRMFSIETGLRLQNIHHFDRSTPEVYTNDRYVITPEIRTTWEHTVAGKMASALFNISYDYTGQDKFATKEKSFFSRSTNFTIGERIRLLSFGDTTFRLKLKNYRNYLDRQDYDSFGFSIDQVAVLPNRNILVALLNYDDIENINSPDSSTASFVFRTDYIITNIIPDLNLNLSLTYSALDTKAQQETRGTEKTWSPSIRLSRRINERMRLSVEHSLSKRSSLNANNEYEKNVTTMELRYLF